MDIRQLAALVAVADHGSFSAAGRVLHTVQSNISTHIARLERELDATLVDRTAGQLTPAGEAVVSRARRIQAELDAIKPDLAALRDEVTGSARLGIIGTVGRWLVPRLLHDLERHYPGLKLNVIDATTTSLAPQVSSGALGLALVNLPVSQPDIVVEPLFEEDQVLVTRRDGPLGRRARLSPDDLVDVPLLLAPRGTSFRDDIDSEFDRMGVSLTAKAEIDGVTLLAAMVGQGLGAAVLPASAVVLDDEIVAIPVDGVRRRTVGLIANRRIPLAATTRTVVDVLRAIIAEELVDREGLHSPAVARVRYVDPASADE